MALDFITTGISEFFSDGYAWLVKKWVIAQFEIKLWSLELAYDIAKELVESLNISATVEAALKDLDSNMLKMLYKLRVIEGINILFNGWFTAIVFKFLPH